MCHRSSPVGAAISPGGFVLACKELSKMPEANYLLSVSWGYIKVGLIPEGLLIPELLMAVFFLCCVARRKAL